MSYIVICCTTVPIAGRASKALTSSCERWLVFMARSSGPVGWLTDESSCVDDVHGALQGYRHHFILC